VRAAGSGVVGGGAAAVVGGACGLPALFAALQLLRLDLSSNALGDASAVHLARLIGREGSTLQTLSLSDNKIGDEGGAALGRAISCAGSLRRLGLSGNPLGDRAGAAIVEGLEGSSLLSLGLEATGVPYSCVVAAGRSLALNQRRWEESRPRRFEHRRMELQATVEELQTARVALARRREEVEEQERRLDGLIMQLAVVTEGIEARKAAVKNKCAPGGGPFRMAGRGDRGRLMERIDVRRWGVEAEGVCFGMVVAGGVSAWGREWAHAPLSALPGCAREGARLATPRVQPDTAEHARALPAAAPRHVSSQTPVAPLRPCAWPLSPFGLVILTPPSPRVSPFSC
jgi:hypothetical protein